MKQTPQTAPTQSRTVQMGSKNSPKFPTIRSQVLGPIKRSFKASNQPKHYKTLKQSVTSSRIKPLPHGVCKNSNFLVSTRSSHCVDQLFLQFRRKPVPIFVDLRKKRRERKKLKSLYFSSPSVFTLLMIFLHLIIIIILK